MGVRSCVSRCAVRSVSLCCAVVVGVLATACAPAQPVAESTVVYIRIGLLPATAAAPILVPLNTGDFAGRGLNVTFEAVTDTAQVVFATASGHFDMGSVTMGPAALNAFNRGTDVKIVASASANPPGPGTTRPLIVRTALVDSGAVKSVADLKGRKVAINGRGGVEYGLAKALATTNLKTSDVDVVMMPFPEHVMVRSVSDLQDFSWPTTSWTTRGI